MTEDFFMRLCDVYGFAPSRALRELVDAAIGQAVVAERYKAARLAEPVQQGCEHCNQPLYAAVKCRVCGRVTSAEPVQESAICDECGKSKHDGWALYCVRCVEPMFAPPQRKPLTETSAERTLKRLGYTDCGGEFWKPPLGAPAEPVQEPVQEPVAIADGTFNHDCPIGTLLYTAPPQRKPLTEEEIRDLLEAEFLGRDGKRSWDDDLQVFRLAERAHKIGGEA